MTSVFNWFGSSDFRTCQLVVTGVLAIALLAGCWSPPPTPAPFDPSINLDAETQALISHARRTVFLIPFSHWDTDWHETFEVYSKRADQNILAAIQVAKEHSRFRYTLEQVLFAQHFWETHPESRADLKALVKNRQITFAWAGITQPETSLAAPGVHWHNLILGKEWIAQTFGPEFVPTNAWQSDAFGNSAAPPLFLVQAGIPHLFLGRWQQRCDPSDQDCQPLPNAFYWKSPLVSAESTRQEHILVASVTYSAAWGALLNKDTPDEQIAALQAITEEQFGRTTSRYLFLPYGFDFLDPTSALLDLVEWWNKTNRDTALVIADPETAFHYLASQDLPELTVDLNPLWQAFYGTRPYARIADKESEFYLTATDKFGLLLDPARAGDWQTAAINAHYDNISAVGYDQVWGPLHGVPITIKDAFETAGLRTTSGYPPLASYIPQQDATVVARLRAAGAIIFGKTNMPPLAFGFLTDGPLLGSANNPWDTNRTPGAAPAAERQR